MDELEQEINNMGEENNADVQEPTEPQTDVQAPENTNTQTEPQQDNFFMYYNML